MTDRIEEQVTSIITMIHQRCLDIDITLAIRAALVAERKRALEDAAFMTMECVQNVLALKESK
jgi:hypothetical protein